jgi:hypothetical protein
MLRKRARTFEPSWAKVGDETKLPREEEKDQKSNKIKKENRKQIKENPKTNPKKREKSLFDPGRHFPVPYKVYLGRKVQPRHQEPSGR